MPSKLAPPRTRYTEQKPSDRQLCVSSSKTFKHSYWFAPHQKLVFQHGNECDSEMIGFQVGISQLYGRSVSRPRGVGHLSLFAGQLHCQTTCIMFVWPTEIDIESGFVQYFLTSSFCLLRRMLTVWFGTMLFPTGFSCIHAHSFCISLLWIL